MKEVIFIVKKEFVNRYKKGYLLIFEEVLENIRVLNDEG